VALTDIECKNAKPKEKPYKLAGGGGMFLLVQPNGKKHWRLKYRYAGKENQMSLGQYPAVSLKAATQQREEQKANLAKGLNPGVIRRDVKNGLKAESENSFQVVALEWHKRQSGDFSEDHAKKILRWLETKVFPKLGPMPINQITTQHCAILLESIAKEKGLGGKPILHTAHRIKTILGQVFKYAKASGRAQAVVTDDLYSGLLPVETVRHRPAIIDPTRLGQLLRDIDSYMGLHGGHYLTWCALRLSPLIFQRPGDLRCAEWAEFDLDVGVWAIPIARMKNLKRVKQQAIEDGGVHVVPLSRQALTVLKELHKITGHRKVLFPNQNDPTRPFSDGTLNKALRTMGYDTKTEMTTHGWRAVARTLTDEDLSIPVHITEQQLAHAVRDALGRAYNRTKHLKQRKDLMQQWADYLDKLKGSGEKSSPEQVEIKSEIFDGKIG
jgi:integrase